MNKSCSVIGCERVTIAKGLCSMHWQRQRYSGEVGGAGPVRMKAKGVECSVEGCDREAQSREVCPMHYRRTLLTGEAGAAKPKYRQGHTSCEVPGCDRKYYANGYCLMHDRRVAKHGDTGGVHALRVHGKPIGATMLDNRGYVRVKVAETGSSWYPQHRHVMECQLGRRLLAGESVHHINGDRQDNRIENLELWSRVQPAGQRVADKIAWAKDLLATYEPQALATSAS
jgi:hypothetical protein